MSDIQLSRSGISNNHYSNYQNTASFKNKNLSASRTSTRKPSNKCLQNNLIYAMYLPLQFEEENMIKSQNHFGQYGNIESIIYAAGIKSKNDDQQAEHIQAYITYNNQKEAALAIVAVNEIPYQSKVIRTTYGTNRMCNSFYTGGKCTVRNCFYLHDQKKCINIQGPLKTDFDKQKIIAQQIVKKNLHFYITKIQSLKQHTQLTSTKIQNTQAPVFPSIQQTINKLIQRNVISKATYKQAYQQYLNTKKKMSQSVKKIQYIRYKKKPEPLSESPINQNSSTLTKIQIKQTQQKINLCKKSSLKQQPKSVKCQFLMGSIIKSLDQLDSASIKRQVNAKKSMPIKEFQIVGKSQEPLSIYWQFLDEKEECKSDQLQTQESETQIEHLEPYPIEFTQPRKDLSRKYSSPQYSTDNSNIMTRLKQEICRNPLIKKSRLQFAQATCILQKKKQFQKVTVLLKNSLIK